MNEAVNIAVLAESSLLRRLDYAVKFGEAHHKHIESCLADISAVRFMLAMASVEADPAPSTPYLDCLALLNQAQETTISGLVLARQHQVGDALALLRIALESASVALHIHFDRAAFDAYAGKTNKRYDTNSSIKNAGKHVSELPRLWGCLSSEAVHRGARYFGLRTHGQDAPQHVLLFDAPLEASEEVKSLQIIALTAAFLIHACELVLLEEVPNDATFRQLPGGRYRVSKVGASRGEARLHSLLNRMEG